MTQQTTPNPASTSSDPPKLIPKEQGIALASLILGTLSFTGFGFTTGIPAIICGHIAYRRIAASGGALGGGSRALAGMILGYVNAALCVVVAIVAIPNYLSAREITQAQSCVKNLRLIDGAKTSWFLEHAKSGEAKPTAEDLKPYLNQMPSCPADPNHSFRTSYRINDGNTAPECRIHPAGTRAHRLPE